MDRLARIRVDIAKLHMVVEKKSILYNETLTILQYDWLWWQANAYANEVWLCNGFYWLIGGEF